MRFPDLIVNIRAWTESCRSPLPPIQRQETDHRVQYTFAISKYPTQRHMPIHIPSLQIQLRHFQSTPSLLRFLVAPVIEYDFDWSTVTVSHTGSPVSALSAMSRPSRVPTKIFPLYKATPRLTTSQQINLAWARGTCGSKLHIVSPLPASMACTTLHVDVV